jgi:hypothetical protein
MLEARKYTVPRHVLATFSILVASLGAALAPAAAGAATVSLAGSGQMAYSYEFLANSTGYSTLTGSPYPLDVPGTYTFSNTLGTRRARSAPARRWAATRSRTAMCARSRRARAATC